MAGTHRLQLTCSMPAGKLLTLPAPSPGWQDRKCQVRKSTPAPASEAGHLFCSSNLSVSVLCTPEHSAVSMLRARHCCSASPESAPAFLRLLAVSPSDLCRLAHASRLLRSSDVTQHSRKHQLAAKGCLASILLRAFSLLVSCISAL